VKCQAQEKCITGMLRSHNAPARDASLWRPNPVFGLEGVRDVDGNGVPDGNRILVQRTLQTAVHRECFRQSDQGFRRHGPRLSIRLWASLRERENGFAEELAALSQRRVIPI